MFSLRLIYTRLYGLLHKGRVEQEMEEELRFHLRMRTRENIEHGMDEIHRQFCDVTSEASRLGVKIPHLAEFENYFTKN